MTPAYATRDHHPKNPEWGDSRYLDVRLAGDVRLADALNHLYVLLPVLDDTKHYWVSNDEVEKLIRAGGGWLATHPEKTLISRRYLSHRRELAQSAMARLAEVDDAEVEQFDNAVEGVLVLDAPDRPVPLAEQRRGAVLAAVRASGARTVGDFGCGEGVLVRDLLAERGIDQIVAVDVSARALQIAGRRLRLDKMTEQQRERLRIFQPALTYRDDRLAGLDAAVLMEVVEHVDPPRLEALERTVFGHAAPVTVIVTTPNVEHNVRFETLPAGAMRHRDHRFEWTRSEFQAWADTVATGYGYAVRYLPGWSRSPGGGTADADGDLQQGRGGMTRELTVPELSLVVLIGVSGSGKSTFGRAHFRPTEVISSNSPALERRQSRCHQLRPAHRCDGRRPVERSPAHDHGEQPRPREDRHEPRRGRSSGRLHLQRWRRRVRLPERRTAKRRAPIRSGRTELPVVMCGSGGRRLWPDRDDARGRQAW